MPLRSAPKRRHKARKEHRAPVCSPASRAVAVPNRTTAIACSAPRVPLSSPGLRIYDTRLFICNMHSRHGCDPVHFACNRVPPSCKPATQKARCEASSETRGLSRTQQYMQQFSHPHAIRHKSTKLIYIIPRYHPLELFAQPFTYIACVSAPLASSCSLAKNTTLRGTHHLTYISRDFCRARVYSSFDAVG